MWFKKFCYPLLWGLLILILSATPNKKMPSFNLFQLDKIGHFTFYGIFAALWVFSFSQLGHSFKKAAWYGFLIAAAYGMLIEWCQGNLFVDRSFDYADELANCIGAALGVGSSYWVIKWWRKKG